ncbi:MAG: flagellar basal body L-ring protein FlgH [Gemmatimonadaceae bacterium]
MTTHRMDLSLREFRYATHLLALVAVMAVLPGMALGQGKGKKTAATAVADSFALQPATRQSWTSDRMHFAIGDIVTILITERTQASANLADNNSGTRRRQLGLDIEPPASPTGVSTSVKATMDFQNDGASHTSGAAIRQNDFRSLISARVIGISPTGMLQIRGHKLVNVDNNKQDVVLTGWVRPQDIAVGTNTVESARIADAEIKYGQQGALGRPRSGIISRLLGALWP